MKGKVEGGRGGNCPRVGGKLENLTDKTEK